MKRWRIFVNGTNFRMPFELEGEGIRVRRMGFYTTVFVVALTAQQAESKAMDVLRRDKKLHAAVRNTRDDPPRMFADEIQEISSFHGCRRPRTGFGFYAERGPKRKK